MTTTGEQPKAETPLGENSTVRVSLVVALLGLAATAGAAHYRIGAQEKAGEDQAQIVREQAKEIADLRTRVTVGESNFAELKSKLEKMDGKLDRLLEGRGNRSANYSPRGPGQ